ncbi:MAG: 30S ribosomal protein S5 [Armatimonadetes bacterium]|nr:30S ribosomal protein S5 [Armatimonadota bacterium]
MRPNTSQRPALAEGFEERIIRTNKVQKTHKGGRTLSWSVLVAVGDRNGNVGAGLGKALSIPDAIRKGTEAAKKNMLKVPMVGGTIPHDILVDFGASRVLLKPAAPGAGVVAGGAVRAILELAGVKDVLAKSLGSNNAVNNAWATMKALGELRTAAQVSRTRGVGLERMSLRPEVREAAESEVNDGEA